LVAWRAGYDPLRGADFFTRLEQAANQASTTEATQLAQYKDQALQVNSQCETWTTQWNSGQLPHTQHNADAINQRCNLYRQVATTYNTQMAQQATNAAQAKVMDDHPDSQERIAAIAAETDWLHGARSLASMQSYPRTHTVIVALLQANSPIFAGIKKPDSARSAPATTSADTPATGASHETPTEAPAGSANDAEQRHCGHG
jgi:hypothetical protein